MGRSSRSSHRSSFYCPVSIATDPKLRRSRSNTIIAAGSHVAGFLVCPCHIPAATVIVISRRIATAAARCSDNFVMWLHGDGPACSNAEATEMTVLSTSGAVSFKPPWRPQMLVKCLFLPLRDHVCTAPIGAFAWTNHSSWYHEAFSRSSTALQAQTLVLHAGVDVVTVGESVAVDEGDSAAGGVLLILLPLHRKVGLILVTPTTLLLLLLLLLLAIPPAVQLLMFLLLTASLASPQLLLSNSHAGVTTATPPLTATSSAATLPKTTNGKRMGVARRRRCRRRHLRFLQLLYFAVGIQCANGMLYQYSCDVGRGDEGAFLDIESSDSWPTII